VCLSSSRRFWAMSVILLAFVSLLASADTPDVPGTMVVTVRAPDGHLLRSVALKTYAAVSSPWPNPVPSTPTDSQGRLTVSLPIGLHRLFVVVPGIGFGSTGVVPIRPGQVLTVAMPPLAPFAHISGTVPPALLRRGETVETQYSQPGSLWNVAPASVDVHGNFTLTDVFPGHVQLSLKAGPQNISYTSLQAAPGESCAGVVFKAYPPTQSLTRFEPMGGSDKIPLETLAIHGTVTDDQGRPVAGATVSADVPKPVTTRSFFVSANPFFNQSIAMSVQTKPDGSYVIPDVSVNQDTVDIPLSATLAGYPPALGDALRAANSESDFHGSLIISNQHTAVSVRVIQNGNPLSGINVNLSESAGISSVTLYWNDRNNLTSLSGTTGSDGIARFVDITPGLWNVQATRGQFPSALSSDTQSVSVQIGTEAECDLNLFSISSENLPLQLFDPQGMAAPISNVEIRSTALLEIGGTGTTLPPDANGVCLYTGAFTSPGLWNVGMHYRNFAPAEPNWFPETTEPYFAASALVAVSPALPPPGTLALRAAYAGPGSIRARLQDAHGHAALGTMIITDFVGGTEYAASTDARGEVVFADMPSGKYTLIGYLAGQPSPPTLSGNGDQTPLPTDAELSGQTEITPLVLTVTANQETVSVLRAHPVGYLRGNIKNARFSGSNYEIDPTYTPQGGITLSQAIIDPKTGEFVDGPFDPGPVSLPLFQQSTKGINTRVAMVKANIAAGHVISATVTPALPYPNIDTTPGLTNPVTGTVFFSDGHTPAWRAQTVLYLPSLDPDFPSGTLLPQKLTDALGRLPGLVAGNSSLVSYITLFEGEKLPPLSGASPTTPVLVSWMPGLTGAAITPYVKGQDTHIVLPTPLNVQGCVTVAGGSAVGLPSTFEIRAVYQGRGELNQLLDRDAIALPDGTFQLSGMTPGTYRVQAARDGIWLSATQALVVGAESLPVLTLDIGLPGAPVTVHLQDAHGHSLVGHEAILDVPNGPLTAILWPDTVTSDGAGDLHLDGLTAGTHTVRPIGLPSVTFTVPPVLEAAP
jgi:hypothetical protein